MHDDGDETSGNSSSLPDLEKAGDYNLGDDLTRVGEGHDEVENEVL